ncbi:hypothetical protein JQS43_14285 [Natronosporangium hydrolyticum]|uniref:Uncharacterized protein n=1 Tax=Natronosporangium hydrolyticum TaxID=2811111 RepID=A0A895YGM9_9ACTN|nr:hypothetical protein [Natronosporangium hydrolyticum]QSB12848.1 hypothetical protein JQS43_14285 [Natronosporangium hydrolyticum]
MSQLAGLVWSVVRATWPIPLPLDVRRAAASEAIQAMLTAGHPPASPSELVSVGIRGVALAQRRHTPSPALLVPSDLANWALSSAAPDTSEQRLVDLITLAQVWAMLPEADQEAVAAVVEHRELPPAAEALGVDVPELQRRLSQARRRFATLLGQ